MGSRPSFLVGLWCCERIKEVFGGLKICQLLGLS
jgi:hypothetical protein